MSGLVHVLGLMCGYLGRRPQLSPGNAAVVAMSAVPAHDGSVTAIAPDSGTGATLTRADGQPLSDDAGPSESRLPSRGDKAGREAAPGNANRLCVMTASQPVPKGERNVPTVHRQCTASTPEAEPTETP